MTDAEFALLYRFTTNAELARQLGVSPSTVSRRARGLGVRKDASHYRAMQHGRMIGRTLGPTTRAKIAAKAMGRRVTEAAKVAALRTKRARGTLLRGDRHPNWKGGRPWERYRRPEYIAWRSAVLDRDRYCCTDCGKQCLRYESGLAAHHLLSYAKHPESRYDVANGVTLCRRCHMARHGKSTSTPRRVPCACGCEATIPDRDPYGRPRRFVNYRAARGRPMTAATKDILRVQRAGLTLSRDHRAKISAGLRSSHQRIGHPARGGHGANGP